MIDILEFNYDNKKYLAYIENNEVKFGYYKGSKLVNKLNKLEDNLIKTIYNYIIGSKEDLIELKEFKYMNSQVLPYYNPKNHLYSFNSDNIDAVKALNYLFNNYSMILNEKEKKFDPKKYSNEMFQILIGMGAGIITVLVSTSLFLSALPNIPNHETAFTIDYGLDSLYKNVPQYDNTEIDVLKTLNIMLNNSNLTEDEKRFLLGSRDELLENVDYINFEQLDRNLKELKIVYNPVESDGIVTLYPTSGDYTFIGSNRNTINLYGTLNSYNTDNLDNCDKSTLVHEFNHLFESHPAMINMDGKFGDFMEDLYLSVDVNYGLLQEMVNELFSREYLGDYTNQELVDGYYWLMPVMYALAEIVDEDTLRTFKFNPDVYYITNYLVDIGVPTKDIFELYKSLEIIPDLYSKANEPTATAEDKKACQDNFYNIYNIVGECYQCKYGMEMENDLNMLLCFYNSLYVDEEYNKMVNEKLGVDSITTVVPRGYVSKKYKENHPNFLVYNTVNKDENYTYMKIIKITDDIRYIDPTKTY